jgi:hypothetical protein
MSIRRSAARALAPAAALAIILAACSGGPGTTTAPVISLSPTAVPTVASTIASTPAPAATSTAVDGTWEVTFTEKEMIAAGIADSGEDNPSNYGHFTLALHAGTWLLDQLSPPQDNSGNSGTYVIVGTNILITKDNGEGPFAYPFTVTATTLTFGQGGPVTFRVKPWTRVGP